MASYALIETSTSPYTVVNLIAIDNPGDYTPDPGFIIVQSDTALIGDHYDPDTGEFTTPPPSKAALKAQATVDVGQASAAVMITCGVNIIDPTQINFPLILSKIASENTTDTRTIKDLSGAYQTVTNQNVIDAYADYADLLEKIASVTKSIYDDINNEVVTTLDDVDSAVSTYWIAVSARTDLTAVRVLISEKEDQSGMLDALAGLDLAENQMVLGGSTTDTFNLLTTGTIGRALMAASDAAGVKSSLSLGKGDVGLGNVANADTTTTANISDSSGKRFVSDAQKTVIAATSGSNTGDQDLSGLVPKTTSVNSKPLSSNITLNQDDVGDGTTNKAYTATEKTKLAGIASGATANSADSYLLNRTNHTGSQAISTVSGLQTALDSKQGLITAGAAISDASTAATTSASASSVTILGISVPTASSYTALITDYNDLAVKYNDLATKVNTLMAHLRAQGLQSS